MNLRVALGLIALAIAFGLSAGCSSKGGKDEPPVDPVIKPTSTQDALRLFDTRQTFWSWVRKTVAHGGRLYSLVYFQEAPRAAIEPRLVVHSTDGDELAQESLPAGFTLLDIAVSPSGHVVRLASREVKLADGEIGYPLKELTVFVDTKAAFVFKDSKQGQAVFYDREAKPAPAKHFDPERTLFLTSSSRTEFARVVATEERIFISATGSFGFKIFAFDYSGRELAQADVLAQTPFNTMLLDKEAPYLTPTNGGVAVAITTSADDRPAFKKHFGVDLAWDGPKYQSVVRAYDAALVPGAIRLAKGSGNFFTSGVVADGGAKVAVFGSSGGAGGRNALAVVLGGRELSEQMRAEFSFEHESSAWAAAFSGERLFVAGSTGSKQVQSGSVVNPADSFIAEALTTGEARQVARFGTTRNDRVSSLLPLGGEIYVSGFQDGPITHTADSDANQAYQKWYLGRLRR